MTDGAAHDPACPRLCPTCADRRDIAERVLRLVEANRIRDEQAMEWIDCVARDACAENARKAIARMDEADRVPF